MHIIIECVNVVKLAYQDRDSFTYGKLGLPR
jgi:hypothetical protein